VTGLDRTVGRHAVVERTGPGGVEHGGGGAADKPVEQHRHPLFARAEHGAGHRREFAPAQPAQSFERIVQRVGMARQAGRHGLGLARETGIVDPGAAANPIRRLAAEQGARERRGRGRVGDAHLAKTQQIGIGVDAVASQSERSSAVGLAHRRLDGEIRGRPVEFQIMNLERGARRTAELVDGGAAGLKVRHHLNRHFGRKRRHAARRYPVIAGEDQGLDMVGGRWVPALPTGRPGRQRLQPRQRPGRLGKLRLARMRRIDGRLVGAGKRVERRSDRARVHAGSPNDRTA
jgi:hypothetical protein